MSDIVVDLPKNVTRIWDLCVPIVIDKDLKIVTAYMSGAIEEPFLYNELCYQLGSLTKEWSVYLYINTPGGIIDSAFMVIDSVQTTKANVTAYLSGTVASAGTMIAMVCDNIVVSPQLSFMIHNYSGGMSGKGNEMKARQKFVDDHLNSVFTTFYSGFLTADEIDNVIEGTDMWMGHEEVTERWSNRLVYLKGEV